VDCATNTVVDSIQTAGDNPLCDAVRGKVYATDQNRDDVFILDARANTLIKTIPLGDVAEAPPCWNQTDSRVYIGGSGCVYVIRDTTTGIAENRLATARPQLRTTVVGGSYRYHGPGAAALVDVAGRAVLALRPGNNSLAAVRPGVYTVMGTTGVGSRIVKAQ
jgi:YVTN family beta-propeller protein